MKNLIYLFVAVLTLLACERSVVEPIYEETSDFQKQNLAENDSYAPRKSYQTLSFLGEYAFNPDDINDQKGGFLSKTAPKYSYENSIERSLRNLKLYSPGKLTVGKKNYDVINVYTINKYERLSKKGDVVSGNTWGDFKIYLKKSDIKDEETPNKLNSVSAAAANKIKLGDMILSGQFNGKINGKKVNVALSGNGDNLLKGSKLTGREVMTCGGKFCWNSKSTGKVVKTEFKDE